MLFIWNGPSQGVDVGNRRKHKPVDEYEFMRPHSTLYDHSALNNNAKYPSVMRR